VTSPVGNQRVQAAQRTRAKLLETGLALAEELGLEGLSVNAVVESAGVSKGTFFHHFGDRVTYLVALHRGFHDSLSDQVDAVVRDVPAGLARLDVAVRTFLDGCLRDRGVKALLLEARGLRPLRDEVLRRNQLTVDFVEPDFEALGWPHPRRAARLWIGAAAECALVELEIGGPDEPSRVALMNFAARA
jgi:TetR/AcrR family transcriptional regulator, transcriptional repressor for nem operon